METFVFDLGDVFQEHIPGMKYDLHVPTIFLVRAQMMD